MPPRPFVRLRRHVTAVVAGIIALSLAAGGSAAYAYWTATAQATAAVRPLSVAITTANFPALSTTYVNTLTKLSSTGTVTVTNSGQAAGTVSATIAGSGSLGPLLPLRAWVVTNAADCTASAAVPTGAISGTWASTTFTSATPLAGGASRTWCVRTEVADRTTVADTSGSKTVTGALTATLSGTGWQSATATAAATLNTAAIYPLSAAPASAADARWYAIRPGTNASLCLDISGNLTAAGTNALTWRCVDGSLPEPYSNRVFQFQRVDTAGTVVTLRSAHAPAMRLAARSTDDAVVLAAASDSSALQRWHVQTRGGGAYQLVNQATGKCLILSTTSGANTTVGDCNLPAAAITLEAAVPVIVSSTSSEFTVDLGWTYGGGNASIVQYESLGGLLWSSCRTLTSNATLALGSSRVTCTYPSGSGTLRVISSGGLVLSQFTIVRSGSTVSITGVTP